MPPRKAMPEPTLIDLFSGAGGFTLGFRLAGFRPILAVEREEDFAATYAENFGAHALTGDIEALLAAGRLDRRADVVIGGPPCQGFSNLTGNKASDPRRELWRAYMEAVERADAKVFVVENVQNFLTSHEGRALVAEARRLGYEIDETTSGVLNAADYGVPQARKRAIIIGSRIGKIPLPEPTRERRTVRDAFRDGCHRGDRPIPARADREDLERLPASGPELHLARHPTAVSAERYRAVPPGGNRFDLLRNRPDITPACWVRKKSGGTDLFGRLWWDRPSVTIRTEFYKPEKGRYLHPVEHRPITHWEALRLQSFPDSFRFHGSKHRIAVQIGNAVPPLLGFAVAEAVMAGLRRARRRHVGETASKGLGPERGSAAETRAERPPTPRRAARGAKPTGRKK
jgi:DNA (cytosine-5)-methyltransferase 1